jgi:hypothetical protein
MNKTKIEIFSVENGWVMFVDRDWSRHQGVEMPRYVFTKEEDVAIAVRNLLHHGTIGAPVPATDEQTAELLSH